MFTNHQFSHLGKRRLAGILIASPYRKKAIFVSVTRTPTIQVSIIHYHFAMGDIYYNRHTPTTSSVTGVSHAKNTTDPQSHSHPSFQYYSFYQFS